MPIISQVRNWSCRELSEAPSGVQVVGVAPTSGASTLRVELFTSGHLVSQSCEPCPSGLLQGPYLFTIIFLTLRDESFKHSSFLPLFISLSSYSLVLCFICSTGPWKLLAF